MPRSKRTEVNPVSEMPVIEVTPAISEPDKVIVDGKGNSNVIPFTSSEQPMQSGKESNLDTTQIDQFLAQYGIEIV